MESKPFLVTLIIILALIIPMAFIFRPIKQFPLNYYFAFGCVILVLLFFLPFLNADWTIGNKILGALGLPFVGAAVWVVGFVLADYKIIDRLF
jgi:hypothetical protein